MGVHDKKDHIKISPFTKFEALSIVCNHVESFQKSEKLDTLHGIWLTLCNTNTFAGPNGVCNNRV